jgi:hypothetical protein
LVKFVSKAIADGHQWQGWRAALSGTPQRGIPHLKQKPERSASFRLFSLKYSRAFRAAFTPQSPA